MKTIIDIIGTLGIGAVIGVFVDHLLRTHKEKQENKLSSYRKLMGIKITLRQAVVSQTEAYLTSDYYEARYGITKSKFDFSEAVRLAHKSENSVIIVTNEFQKLFEVMGDISLLFKNDQLIQTYIDKLYRYRTLKTVKPPENISIQKLTAWRDKGIRQIQQLVENEYGKPIEVLIKRMSKGLNPCCNFCKFILTYICWK